MEKTQHIIIFEGHDMVGKSTIATALSERIKAPVIKMEKPWKHDPLVELMYGAENICQLIQQTDYSFILDRFHPSEYVYSRVFNRVTSHEQIIKLDERLAEMGAVIFVFYKQEAAFQHDPDDKIELAKYHELIRWYREFEKITKCKIVFIDTSDENLEAQLQEIENNL